MPSVFTVFLKDLIQDAQRKVFLIVDNLRVHRANRVRANGSRRTPIRSSCSTSRRMRLRTQSR